MFLLIHFLTESHDLLPQWSTFPFVQMINTDFWYRSRDLSYDVINSYHFRPNISETVGDTESVTIGSL